MSTQRPIKGVLFDLGNTLLDFNYNEEEIVAMFRVGARTAYNHLQEQGHRLPSFNNFHRQQLRQMRWRASWSSLVRRDFNAMRTMGRITRSIGLKLSKEQLEELCWLWYAPLSNTATVEAGLREVLDWLVSAKLKLGIVSNTFVPGEILDKHLKMEGLLKYFPVRVYSCDTKFRKPNRKIFRKALEMMSCEPEEVIFVGDIPRNDVRGARRLGMVAVLKDFSQEHGLRDKWMPYTKPDFTITHMRQLRAIIEKLQQA